jgi:hypothetical protein
VKNCPKKSSKDLTINSLYVNIRSVKRSKATRLLRYTGDMKMTKNQFKEWLKEHKGEIVGWAGRVAAETPVNAFARAINFDGQLPLWALRCSQYFRQYEGVPGRVNGWDAYMIASEKIGY